MFREAGRVRGPDQEARRSLVSNIINVCANMEGKEVVTTNLANIVGKSTVRVVEGSKWMWDKWVKWVKWELRLERIHL